MSYDQPNYTQMPNVLLDKHMPDMKEAELRVTFAIARQTLGWHRDEDRISISQLEEITGMSRQGVQNGIADAIDRGVIERRQIRSGAYYYRLAVTEDGDGMQPSSTAMQPSSTEVCNDVAQPMQLSSTEVCNEVDPPMQRSSTEVCNDVAPQKKRKKPTKKKGKETNPPNHPKKTDGGGAGKPKQPTPSRNVVDLLTDPDIEVQPEIAAKLSENLEWDLTLRHCCQYLQDLNAGRVEGVGVLVHRLRKGRDTNPVTPVAQRYDFYKRHVPPDERSQHSLAPEKDFVGEYSDIVRT